MLRSGSNLGGGFLLKFCKIGFSLIIKPNDDRFLDENGHIILRPIILSVSRTMK